MVEAALDADPVLKQTLRQESLEFSYGLGFACCFVQDLQGVKRLKDLGENLR